MINNKEQNNPSLDKSGNEDPISFAGDGATPELLVCVVGREYSSLEGKRVFEGLELMLLRSGFPVDFRRRRRFGCHQWRSGSVGLIGLCLRLDFAGKGNRVATGKWK
ncbi:hypothetical protein KY290_036360 [Solanum tuberosum]|uniref:Uncharacterized protein n=1 Tax=Solanum tuberosum TaxID=4113 RepID=A0ABQ7TT47_SOLTU|nr:hypothetical protein KY289_035880 [Solanum tuberosum]KAH0639061.1 hypothetical protein KY285_035647 [Solanum tuberosum]KAH0737655.1 hypothetical protein KY290_036360 [Solanum tuberosum]